jgi:phosphatidylglycerophosphate synthase
MATDAGVAGRSVGTFTGALGRLRAVQNSSRGAPAYSRWVNRPVGRVLAAGAYTLGLTPDQVTCVSALCTFAGIATIATVAPAPASALAACLLLVLGYALDSADGQLARLRGGGTVAGEWLDHVVDAVKLATLHLAVLVSWYRFGDRPDRELLVPLAFQVVSSVAFFAMILNDRIHRAEPGPPAGSHPGSSEPGSPGSSLGAPGDAGRGSALYSLATVFRDYGLLCLALALMPWDAAFGIAYGTLLAANGALLAVALVKWYREMRAYDGRAG